MTERDIRVKALRDAAEQADAVRRSIRNDYEHLGATRACQEIIRRLNLLLRDEGAPPFQKGN